MILPALALAATLFAVLRLRVRSSRNPGPAAGWLVRIGTVVELLPAREDGTGRLQAVVSYPLDRGVQHRFVGPAPRGARDGSRVEVLVNPDDPYDARLVPPGMSRHLAHGQLKATLAFLVVGLLGAWLLLSIVARLR